MAITTGGGIAYDEGASVRGAGSAISQTIGQMDQRRQFQQQQALAAGAEGFKQLMTQATMPGVDPEEFIGKNRASFAKIQQLMSVAAGKPVTFDEAMSVGLGATSDYFAQNQSLQSKVLQALRYLPKGEVKAPPSGGGGEATTTQNVPAKATDVAASPVVEPSGQTEVPLTPSPIAPAAQPVTQAAGVVQMGVRKPGVLEENLGLPPGVATMSSYGGGVMNERDRIMAASAIASLGSEFRIKQEQYAKQFLSGEFTAEELYKLAEQYGKNKHYSAARAAYEAADTLQKKPQSEQKSPPPAGGTRGSSLPGGNVYSEAAGATADTQSPYAWAQSIPSNTGQMPGTALPTPAPTLAAPQALSASAEVGQFAQSIRESMSGFPAAVTDKILRVATPSLEAKPSSTPRVDAKAEAKQQGLLAGALAKASEIVGRVMESAAARPEGTDMVPLTQREKVPIAEATKRAQMESDRLREMAPEAREVARREIVKWLTTAPTEELEAAGFSDVASRREVKELANIQANAAVDAALARAQGEKGAALMEMRFKGIEAAQKIYNTAVEAAAKEKITVAEYFRKYKDVADSYSMYASLALGEPVSLEITLKDGFWAGIAARFGNYTATGTRFRRAGAPQMTQNPNESYDAAIREYSQP